MRTTQLAEKLSPGHEPSLAPHLSVHDTYFPVEMLPVLRFVAPCPHALASSDAIPQRITYLQVKRKMEMKQAILPYL
jgi:hypothetical protein